MTSAYKAVIKWPYRKLDDIYAYSIEGLVDRLNGIDSEIAFEEKDVVNYRGLHIVKDVFCSDNWRDVKSIQSNEFSHKMYILIDIFKVEIGE